jgi:pyrroloquinoline-quinone synthase
MYTLETRLNEIIQKWSVLNHPFYTAWSEGTLPTEKIKTYAGAYAPFIGKISEAWAAIGDEAIAQIEMEHYHLWIDFSRSLGNDHDHSTNKIEAVSKLVDGYTRSFDVESKAIGALYAFEQQQPGTAQSKLDGLRNHYKALKADETYFDIHKDDFDEPALLLDRIKALSPEAQEEVLESCNITCEKIWNALTGVMESN